MSRKRNVECNGLDDASRERLVVDDWGNVAADPELLLEQVALLSAFGV